MEIKYWIPTIIIGIICFIFLFTMYKPMEQPIKQQLVIIPAGMIISEKEQELIYDLMKDERISEIRVCVREKDGKLLVESSTEIYHIEQ